MSGEPIVLDKGTLLDHPLPALVEDTDKNDRGRVLAIGGSRTVPGGIALTAEAALRSGAGKVRVATIEDAAIPLGVRLPEMGVIGLAQDAEGEIGPDALDTLARHLKHNDAIVLGPAISSRDAAGMLVDAVLDCSDCDAPLVLDAAALTCLTKAQAGKLRRRTPSHVLTPHRGEMAAMLSQDMRDVVDDPEAAVASAVERFGGVCLLKANHTLIGTRGATFVYRGGCPGLATGGSGDVLAGVIAGLIASGADTLTAALWGVWAHGEAGARCSRERGAVGFLARELLPGLPSLLDRS